MAEGLSPSGPGVGRFPTTRLSLVLAAGGPDRQAQDALATLCRIYWYPLYAYVRRHGYSADDAQDLIQGFIARLLQKKALRDFQPERGRFRSFLLASLKHFLANERASAHALKRGGGVSPVCLDLAMDSGEHRYRMEPRDDPMKGKSTTVKGILCPTARKKILQSQLSGAVLPEQTPIPDVPPNHLN